MITEYPVWDPGSSGIADLYPYEVEIEYSAEPAPKPDPLGPEEPTMVTPPTVLVERCQTSAALRWEDQFRQRVEEALRVAPPSPVPPPAGQLVDLGELVRLIIVTLRVREGQVLTAELAEERARNLAAVLDGRFEILTRREFQNDSQRQPTTHSTTTGTYASPIVKQRGPVREVG